MSETILKIDNLSKRFGSVIACADVTFDVKSGEIHALIGPNGAGKSTLIKQISGEIPPDSGTIFLDGNDLVNMDSADRAMAGLARTFQVSSVFDDLSVLQNVMLAVQGSTGSSMKFFKPALKDTELTLPAKNLLSSVDLDKKLSAKASELSHGERRQLEFAIALALKPKIFLFDEPMAGIGPGGSKELTRVLSDLKKLAPILLVEHDMEAVFALADRISVLVYGRIIATGIVDEIRSNQKVRDVYLGATT